MPKMTNIGAAQIFMESYKQKLWSGKVVGP